MIKIIALANSLGFLADFRLLPGQAHDLRGTAALLKGLTYGKFLPKALRCELGARCLDREEDRTRYLAKVQQPFLGTI
jgi:hypothetical protein